MTAPSGKYYADPFLFKINGQNYLFFEDYDYRKGVISYVTIDENISFSKPKIALELPTHLSFPFVFSEDENIYMIPETYHYRSVSLYKATEFPKRWEKVRTLVYGKKFSDSILFWHEGYYWLFTAIDKDILQIYYATDLQSTFFPHPINKKRIKGRNAGAIYFSDKALIRPTMDCSEYYGKRMILKEILALTPTEFKEKEIGTIEPTWAPDLIGTHTYSQNEDYAVYDGQAIIDLERF